LFEDMKKLVKDIKYTFGTNSAAARRLEEIGKYFNPLSAGFIRQFISGVPDIAVDLGCGPGITTHMLKEATNCQKIYGLDNSSEFLGIARQQFTNCTFLEHDITQVPFPVNADVMYARFILCHLRDPLGVIHKWTTQLRPEGLLFVEEIDAIETDLEVFRVYLSMAEGIIATQGASLYVGNTLAEAEYKADVLFNEQILFKVPDWQAATWFFPNTQTIWNENSYVLDHLSSEERKSIGDELGKLKEKKGSISNITWRMRRLVIRKSH
jgi:SAM-dependent methyltransferase